MYVYIYIWCVFVYRYVVCVCVCVCVCLCVSLCVCECVYGTGVGVFARDRSSASLFGCVLKNNDLAIGFDDAVTVLVYNCTIKRNRNIYIFLNHFSFKYVQ